jgi:hypothetical protein
VTANLMRDGVLDADSGIITLCIRLREVLVRRL